MRAVAVVPARGGSRRVPRKNLAVLGGMTLVQRALRTACAAGAFAEVVLSSDDPEILAQAEGLPVTLVERPGHLAGDRALAFDVVRHALSLVDSAARFDAVAVVQATSPFTAPEDIAGAMALLEATGAASVVTVVRLEAALHPAKLKRLLDDGRLVPFSEDDRLTPSHDLPPVWVRNGSLYASRHDVLAAGSLLSEDDTRGYEMPAERSFDIDTPRDLAFARFLVDHGA